MLREVESTIKKEKSVLYIGETNRKRKLNQDLTPANPAASGILTASLLPAISRHVPNKLPDPFDESPSELRRDPTTSFELGPMSKLDLGPSSGYNSIVPVIVSPA
ncbi:hypothetical protein GW17_00026547 [Ensete ventricosum]|nr:hypothetical protein GW17_00026547 [Ensete ventricosum]